MKTWYTLKGRNYRIARSLSGDSKKRAFSTYSRHRDSRRDTENKVSVVKPLVGRYPRPMFPESKQDTLSIVSSLINPQVVDEEAVSSDG